MTPARSPLMNTATGIPGGISGEETVLHYFMREDDNPTQVTFDGSGLCSSVDTCVITCENAKAAGDNVVPVPYSSVVSERVCGDNLWGACEYRFKVVCFVTRRHCTSAYA